jgi:hypothetical protein
MLTPAPISRVAALVRGCLMVILIIGCGWRNQYCLCRRLQSSAYDLAPGLAAHFLSVRQ